MCNTIHLLDPQQQRESATFNTMNIRCSWLIDPPSDYDADPDLIMLYIDYFKALSMVLNIWS